MLAINEIFGPTIQGEGQYTGIPSIFVRLNGCNLRCCFGEPGSASPSSICDTPYTSHKCETASLMSAEELAHVVGEKLDQIGGASGQNSHVVITGGEPMLQQKDLITFIEALQNDENAWNPITIETNGTIAPNDKMLSYDLTWSVSPKLSTSCCFEGTDVPEALREQHRKTRINLDALGTIIMSDQNYQLKFVYSGPESVAEIKQIINDVKDHLFKRCSGGVFERLVGSQCAAIDEHIMLMPEGVNVEQLSKSAKGAVQACIENGWRFCDRTHIRIWGDKRAV